MTYEDDLKFFEKLKSTPTLRKRFEEILDIAHNTSGDLITADEAEAKAIVEVRKLGQEVLQEWAINQHERVIETTKKENPGIKKHKKKDSIGNRRLEK